MQAASNGIVDDDKTEKAKEGDKILSASRASVIKHTCEMKILDSNQNNECCTKIDNVIGKKYIESKFVLGMFTNFVSLSI